MEGRGAATIYDVTISKTPLPLAVSTSETLTALLTEREKTTKTLERCKQSISALKAYLATLNVQHVDAAQLAKLMESYDSTGEVLDDKASKLQKELNAIDTKIQEERSKLSGPESNTQLQMQATIGVFAEAAGEIEIVLIYGRLIPPAVVPQTLTTFSSC